MTEKTSTTKTVIFNKNDLLTARSLAAKYKTSIDIVKRTMNQMNIHNVNFTFNNHKSPVVVGSVARGFHVHPGAIDVFKQYLDKQIKEL